MSHTLFIEPVDVLLFRDARPFVAGEGHLARSLFPPPGTVQGIVRTLFLEAMGIAPAEFGRAVKDNNASEKFPEATRLLGLDRSTDGLHCVGPFLTQQSKNGFTVCFPAPLDLGFAAPSQDRLVRLRPAGDLPITTDLPGPFLLWSGEDLKGEGERLYLTEQGLCRYLMGQALSVDGTVAYFGKEADFFAREMRPGVGLERGRRTAKEGLLYWVEFLRLLEGVRFAVRLTAPDCASELESLLRQFSQPRVLPIGGEGRLARVSASSWTPVYQREEVKESIRQNIQRDRRFALLLLTPVFWKAGWRPDFVSDDLKAEWEAGPGKVRARLVAAAVGEPLPLGGWALAEGQPKAMQKAVPAGSVYHFVLEEGSAQQIMDHFHGKSWGQQTDAGYGHTVVAVW